MGPHYLDRLFTPHTIAVFGATDRTESVGMRVFANLIEGGFAGELYAINPKYPQVQGRTSYPTIKEIEGSVDLAVITTPAATVPEIVVQCGEQGVRAAMVLSAGFGEAGEKGRQLQQVVLKNARRYGMRILGPNCLGIMRPRLHLNATFCRAKALPGDLALLSQSGAICAAILDWAEPNHVGFSTVVSLGDAADVNFGDVLDYLAVDPTTKSILLYVEGIQNSRRFISALRAAARMKPVIVVKAGRHAAGTRAAMSHTGALVGADDVFDAALERAGAVRALTIEGLFAAAQILSTGCRVGGDSLAIVTNAGGPGVMATDRAVEAGLRVPELSPGTLESLNRTLPEHWSHGNPVDILGDATAERYRNAVAACLADEAVDGVLAMLTPQAMSDPTGTANAVVEIASACAKPVLGCWMGQHQVEEAWSIFTAAKLPCFHTPEASVEAFGYLTAYDRNQEMLMQVPGPLSYHSEPDVEGAQLIIEGVLADGRKTLTTMEAKAVLTAFHVPVVQTVEVHSANEALVAAEAMGFPVAMKISSSKVSHKSDMGGVRLNIRSAQAVRSTYNDLVAEAARQYPEAGIERVTVERMVQAPNGRELMVGVLRDTAFGPVISFGAGGTTVEVIHDRAVALPPLNRFIVDRLVSRTRIARLLGRFRNMPAVNAKALEDVLLRVSEMVCELPQIREMDINPLIADDAAVVAVDARMVVDFETPSRHRYSHMAIYPYPTHLVYHFQLPDGTDLVIRPIRPEDAQIEQAFVRGLSAESKYFRFMQTLQELTPTMLVRLTQIDYDREMALIAVVRVNGAELEVGVARYAMNPDGGSCEFALVVADDWRNKGIGSRLMSGLMDAARARGLTTMEGEILANNVRMLSLVDNLGFSVHTSEQDQGIKIATRVL